MSGFTKYEILGIIAGQQVFTELTSDTWNGSNKYLTLTENRSLSLTSSRVSGTLYIAGNSSFTLSINGESIAVNASGDSMVSFVKINGQYIVSLDTSPIFAGADDVTAPAVTSMTAISSHLIRVVFDEIMLSVTTAGWSFNNGSALTVTGVSGSDDTYDFVVTETMAIGNTITGSYNSATGATEDLANNELASFTNVSVTNSIGYHLSNFIAANGTAIGSYTPETGGAWSNQAGTFDIQSNKMAVATFPVGNNAICFAPISGSSDYTLKVTATRVNTTGHVQLWIRSGSSTDNYLVVDYGSSIYCEDKFGGSPTVRYNAANGYNNTLEHVYEIVVTGTSVTLKVDGATVTTFSMNASVNGGNIGVGTSGTSNIAHVVFEKVEVIV